MGGWVPGGGVFDSGVGFFGVFGGVGGVFFVGESALSLFLCCFVLVAGVAE